MTVQRVTGGAERMGFEWNGPVAMAALAGPWIANLVAFLVLAGRRRNTSSSGSVSGDKVAQVARKAPWADATPRVAPDVAREFAGEASRAPPPSIPISPDQPVRDPPVRTDVPFERPMRASITSAAPKETAEPEPISEPPTAIAITPLAALKARIAEAEREGVPAEQAILYLGLGRLERDAGANDRAAEALRRAIRISSQTGQSEVHATARLALGDMAEASGDLTTACEHWQLARSLFHDIDQTDAVEGADKRMRARGCPTDWVLNDF